MTKELSLADQLVRFMRVRDEANAKIEAMPREGDAWTQLGIMLEQQEKAVSDMLYQAMMTADRLGRLAEAVQPKKKA